MLILPKIYPVTDARISGLSHTEQVRRLIDGGAQFIQIREKHLPAQDLYYDSFVAVSYARSHGVRIIINDRVDVALAVDADGVHLGQTDLPPGDARKLLGPKAIIGFSTHSVDQVFAALDEPVDYIAVGPIFATTTKENPDAVVGIEQLRDICRAGHRLPVVAIGGVNLINLAETLNAGATSAAVISALYADPGNIATVFRQLMDAAGQSVVHG